MAVSSVSRWLSERVGSDGLVVASDIETKFLVDLPSNVEVRRLDIERDGLGGECCDLVHARSVLVHLTDPRSALTRVLDAVRPGGWLMVEENDLSVLSFSGSPDAARATIVLHKMLSRSKAAGVMDAYFGHRLPGLIQGLGLDEFGVDATIGFGRPGDAEFEVVKLGSSARPVAAALGLEETERAVLDHVLDSPTTAMVSMTLFTTWGRKPQ